MNTSSKFTGILAIAALFGIVALLVSYAILNIGGFVSLVIGVIVAIITWIVLWLGWGEDNADQSTSASGATDTAAPGSGATGMNKPTSSPASAAASAAATATSDTPAAAPAAAKAAKPAAKTTAAKAAPATPKAAKAPAAKAAKAPVAKAAKAPVAKAAKAPAAKAAKAPAAKAASVAADGKPATLTAARASGPDDLKLLKGVGPALEKTLNELGFYHFDQVAAWRKAEVEWVDSRLKFKGRIVRDEWIKQAKTLAKGGETEFSKRSKK
jgi:predicted flap endonuclease-1-like 5' DNA nuclease